MRDEMGKRAMMRAGAGSVWSGCAGYCGGAGSVWSGGVGCCGVEARGVCARSIILNSFGYIAISIVLKRKRLLICNSQKMAKTELYNER